MDKDSEKFFNIQKNNETNRISMNSLSMSDISDLNCSLKETNESVENLKNETSKTFELLCDSLDSVKESVDDTKLAMNYKYDSLYDDYKHIENELDSLQQDNDKIHNNIKLLDYIVSIEAVALFVCILAIILTNL